VTVYKLILRLQLQGWMSHKTGASTTKVR